jgi:FAD-dependent urate hydroxylase
VSGLDVKIFGEPMEFWQSGMPAGMLLRSSWLASTISDPDEAFTLDVFKVKSGNHLSAPVPLNRFVDYGLWFQQSAVPDVDRRRVAEVTVEASGFQVRLNDGEALRARRVVVACGIAPFATRPTQFQALDRDLLSHTSERTDLSGFSGQRVAVIGGGQSALESAALLHEKGAQVQLIVRRPKLHWLGWKERLEHAGPLSQWLFAPTDVGPAGISRIVAVPELLAMLPRTVQDELRRFSIRPAGARWLFDRLKEVPITLRRSVTKAIKVSDGVRLVLDDGSERIVDHVFLGTGYRVNVARYRFLSSQVLQQIEVCGGFPKLGPGMESSLRGLHFLGAPAAWSYGPIMYFVSGTKYAARTLARHVSTAKTVVSG